MKEDGGREGGEMEERGRMSPNEGNSHVILPNEGDSHVINEGAPHVILLNEGGLPCDTA